MSCGRARTHDQRVGSQRLTLSRHTGIYSQSEWFKLYLKNRTHRVYIKDTLSERHNLDCGVD